MAAFQPGPYLRKFANHDPTIRKLEITPETISEFETLNANESGYKSFIEAAFETNPNIEEISIRDIDERSGRFGKFAFGLALDIAIHSPSIHIFSVENHPIAKEQADKIEALIDGHVIIDDNDMLPTLTQFSSLRLVNSVFVTKRATRSFVPVRNEFLKQLDLSNNWGLTDSAVFGYLMKQIGKQRFFPELVTLRLRQNSIFMNHHLKDLLDSVSTNSDLKLRELDLSECFLRDGCGVWIQGLIRLNKLERLHLGGNMLSADDYQQIVDAFGYIDGPGSLRVLSLPADALTVAPDLQDDIGNILSKGAGRSLISLTPNNTYINGLLLKNFSFKPESLTSSSSTPKKQRLEAEVVKCANCATVIDPKKLPSNFHTMVRPVVVCTQLCADQLN